LLVRRSLVGTREEKRVRGHKHGRCEGRLPFLRAWLGSWPERDREPGLTVAYWSAMAEVTMRFERSRGGPVRAYAVRQKVTGRKSMCRDILRVGRSRV
jgi:hypothetical protein